MIFVNFIRNILSEEKMSRLNSTNTRSMDRGVDRSLEAEHEVGELQSRRFCVQRENGYINYFFPCNVLKFEELQAQEQGIESSRIELFSIKYICKHAIIHAFMHDGGEMRWSFANPLSSQFWFWDPAKKVYIDLKMDDFKKVRVLGGESPGCLQMSEDCHSGVFTLDSGEKILEFHWNPEKNQWDVHCLDTKNMSEQLTEVLTTIVDVLEKGENSESILSSVLSSFTNFKTLALGLGLLTISALLQTS